MKFTFDERFKHRFVGVIVIIAIAAVVLPAVMKKSNYRFDRNIHVSVRMPEKPVAPKIAVPSQKVMLQAARSVQPNLVIPSAPVQKFQTVKAERLGPPQPIVAKKAEVSKVAAVAKPTAHQIALTKDVVKSASKEVYVVQLASFTREKNAQSLVNKLLKNGYKASYSKFNSKNGELYKVVVGTLNKENEARDLQKKLASKMQIHGFVVKTGVS